MQEKSSGGESFTARLPNELIAYIRDKANREMTSSASVIRKMLRDQMYRETVAGGSETTDEGMSAYGSGA